MSFQTFFRGNEFGGILSGESDMFQLWALPDIHFGKIGNDSMLSKLFRVRYSFKTREVPTAHQPTNVLHHLGLRPQGQGSNQPIRAQHRPGCPPRTEMFVHAVIQDLDLSLVLVSGIFNKPHKPIKKVTHYG